MGLTVQEKDIVKNTAIAAAVGASATTLANYGVQKHILKNPQSVVDSYTRYIADLSTREAKSSYARQLIESKIKSANEAIQGIQELAKSGKVNNKMLARAATAGAIVAGCGYIAYKGIKSIFRHLTRKNRTFSQKDV